MYRLRTGISIFLLQESLAQVVFGSTGIRLLLRRARRPAMGFNSHHATLAGMTFMLFRFGCADAVKKNIRFIPNDDLRPMISGLYPEEYGYMHTPNLNAFMKESLVLPNSHV